MAKKSKKLKTIITPWGTAVYPCLHKLDTDGKFATNKFKVDIEPSDSSDFDRFKSELAELTRYLDLDEDSTTPIKTLKDGLEVIRLRSSERPMAFDTRNRPIHTDPDDPKHPCVAVGGGSIIRANAMIYPYDEGYTLIITQYQIKELVPFGERGSAFDESDGYEVENEDHAETNGFGVSSGTLDI